MPAISGDTGVDDTGVGDAAVDNTGVGDTGVDDTAAGDTRLCRNDVADDTIDDIATRIMHFCEERHIGIVAAESLTGGLLADAFVRVPGASAVFLGSVVTYDIRAKATILGVDRELLRLHGAVTPEVARQMTTGAEALYSGAADGRSLVALSTTGVAGPGPDGIHPQGEVYIAIAVPDDASSRSSLIQTGVHVRHLQLEGDRQRIRESTVRAVLTSAAELLGV